MKIKKMNGFLKFITGGAIGITLAPFGIYIREDFITHKDIIQHESIHWKQQMEMLILPFYIWYLIEWFIRLFINVDVYRNISFERESYENEDIPEYINNRKSYSWIKYLKLKDR